MIVVCVCVCNLLTQIDQCNENISRKTAQVKEHSKTEAETKVRVQLCELYLLYSCIATPLLSFRKRGCGRETRLYYNEATIQLILRVQVGGYM